jgi:hypothetical protein
VVITSRIVKRNQKGITLPLFTEAVAGVEVVPLHEARALIVANHYTHSFPRRWTRSYRIEDALVVFCYSANPWVEKFLFGESVGLLELARLYAPDGHRPNLLTHAISVALRQLQKDVHGKCEAVISYADPLHGHHGGVYQAASWLYLGRSINPTAYRSTDGQIMARRSFHDGQGAYRPEGFVKVQTPAKYRYARMLSKRANSLLRLQPLPYPKTEETGTVRVMGQ